MKTFSKNWWKYEVLSGIKNIIKWFPIIWNDFDGDYDDIITILRFKLKNTADYLEKNSLSTNVKLSVNEIKLCIKLIDLLNGDEYKNEMYEYYQSNTYFNKDGYFRQDIIKNNLKDYIKKYQNYYNKISDEHKKSCDDLLIANMIIWMREDRAFKLLFEIIGSKIQNWWC